MSRPTLSNVVVMREYDCEGDDMQYYYMVLNDIISLKNISYGEEGVVSELREDRYCEAHDIRGAIHRIYFNDLLIINEIYDEDIPADEIFPMLLGAWGIHRSGTKR